MTQQTEQKAKRSADERFTAGAKSAFDDSVQSLDAATLSRLNQNRQQALERATRSSLSPTMGWWLPASGVAASALVAAVLWTGTDNVLEMTPPSVASDLEIILEVDDLEMLENLEFYSWIDLDELR